MAYASPDRASAQALHDALVALGRRVCFDQEALQPGDDWHRLLPNWVRSSSVVVVLLSARSEEAHYQRSEVITAIDQARRQQTRLIPVRLAPDAWIPYGTEQLQSADMFTPADAPALAARIAAQVPAPPGAPPGPTSAAAGVLCPRVPPVPRHFTGRDQLLATVGATLRGDDAVVLTQTIQGLGGVGKTTLAAALATAHRNDFAIIWWVRAEGSALLTTDLAELAVHLEIPSLDDPADTAAAVRTALETTDRSWLIVFDNAENERSIERWLPLRGAGTVVITSRSTDFPDAEMVPVDVFPPDVAARFLRDRVRDRKPAAADEDLDAVIDRLDGLPLALEQAAAWVARVPERRFVHFVALYDDRDPFDARSRPRGYEATATTTWQVSMDAASEEAPLAARVLSLLAFLAPEPLQTQWLRDMGDHDYFDGCGPQAIDDALAALHAYSLITITSSGTLTVHRVIQSAARRTASPEAASAAIDTLHRQLPADAELPENWPRLSALSPHVLVAARLASIALPSHAAQIVDVLATTSIYQRASGAVGEAISTATTALDMSGDHLSVDHEASRYAANELAGAVQAAGDLEQARVIFAANLADNQRLLGPDDPHTLTSRRKLEAALAAKSAGDD